MTIASEKQFSVSVVVNGEPRQTTVSPRRLLSDFLREDFGLTGTHVGCGTGECGSCTVIVDGETARSCLSLAVQADAATIETIEGMAHGGAMHAAQQAFHAHHALQCGFFTPRIGVAAGPMRRDQTGPPHQD